MKIAFIGGGNMARSMIGGLLDSGMSADSISASDPLSGTRDQLEEDFRISVFADNKEAIANAEVVVLAVKPQQMHSVVSALSGQFAGKLVISIAAGVRLHDMLQWSGQPDTAIVRCMPNTPALLGCGASGLIANQSVSDGQKKQAEKIVSAMGIYAWVMDEPQLDAVTALSGSGPAYFFLMLECMIDAAAKMGIDKETAKTLAIQTALGAAKMAGAGTDTPAKLRQNVTSPAGTTEAAINSFSKDNYSEIIERAMQAAAHRANELGDELGSSHG